MAADQPEKVLFQNWKALSLAVLIFNRIKDYDMMTRGSTAICS